MTKTPLTNRQSYWLDHHHRCKENKLSFEDYCRQNKLSPGAFAHARGKLAKIGVIDKRKSDKPHNPSGFVAVKPAQPPIYDQPAQIIFPGQIKIEVPPALVPILISNLLGGKHDSTR